ncbi:hypothetical protein BASA50_002113 [Batrachochytrium salamandrivorans]|uniref:Guanylate cyclase n=1 Tax=Batrachochytrium salamandrivorans TaxID=1357716 RepID=A0ABQ8FMY5_9FUNG|nr:hypothetical protein BASA60_002663 [Batrachochytrium salamandrivorans]KAH6600730.1 hypothetical protein BASA50_002113 [Batrachochytrium salamandrivorans]KAH9247582.1 hypothetical protein BASA81_014799 [Batrachochytrium salamandrivorans]KAH9271702.1 hypothetical protein BASA83_006070 [Batrachochytrium salamandrivorans]
MSTIKRQIDVAASSAGRATASKSQQQLNAPRTLAANETTSPTTVAVSGQVSPALGQKKTYTADSSLPTSAEHLNGQSQLEVRKKATASGSDDSTGQNAPLDALATNPHDDMDIPEHANQPRSSNSTGGGCPVMRMSSSSQSNEKLKKEEGAFTAAAGSKSMAEQFRSDFNDKNKSLYDSLRFECERIEANYLDAEREVERTDDIAFLMGRHESEVADLISSQSSESKLRTENFEKFMIARKDRKQSKRIQRASIRQTKCRDMTILRQETASQAAVAVRKSQAKRRDAFEKLVSHMEAMHEKQRRQQSATQERKLSYEKMLNELESKHLQEEVRHTLIKKFQVRQSHQVALNKRINDQLRELQQTELRLAKERFELDVACFEESNAMKNSHIDRLAELTETQQTEMYAEKERLVSKREVDKVNALTHQHILEGKNLQHTNRIAVRQMKIRHEQILAGRKQRKADGTQGGVGPILIASSAASKKMSRSGSGSSIDASPYDGSNQYSPSSPGRVNNALNSAVGTVRNNGFNNRFGDEEECEYGSPDSRKIQLVSISALQTKQRDEKNDMLNLHRQEMNDCVLSIEARVTELDEQHQLELDKLRTDHASEVSQMIAVQEKEIHMEQSVHDAEMKMLVERRILNSVLETVVDGIINITPTGTIRRFNAAAENMFGYSSSEVIGKNIKMLMPYRYSRDHDSYLTNYLTTGVKKVIGSGRHVHGLKKDGTEFHLQLSISEVKENDQHLFTGIARDLTEDIRLQEEIRSKDLLKKAELEALVSQLDISRKKADSLLSQMLPPSVSHQLLEGKHVEPQTFESATIFFLDVVGFTTLCSGVSPIETVSLLNAIYNTFDDVIQQYDAYKVETIGDSYMIVSGIPTPNGARHASEIASLALHILSKVHTFKFERNPELQLRVRIGLNTGPVVAGVVGSKMPRYCLFGDSVNTASRMESTSQPMKIQISESTYKALSLVGGYRFTPRGEMDIKGKGKMTTYFLTGKTDFPFELPPQ